ncbi:SRPBCC family protein [Lentzea sp. NPDC034063]|uniref:SRPBCC family protein n=1 Tax=unclassified Lentzea TaxID=2643253 RepID=UPI0033E7ED59
MTRSRSMPADAETVFEVVSDLEDANTWLPHPVEIELSSPGLLRVWLSGRTDELSAERRVAIDWESLRITWGSDPAASCSGTLQVLRLTATRSAVTVRMTGPPGVASSRVDTWIETALNALETVIATEYDRKQQALPAAT